MSLTAGRPKLKLRGLLSRGEPLKVYFPLGVCTDRQRNDSAVCTGKSHESENPSRPALYATETSSRGEPLKVNFPLGVCTSR